MGRNTYEAGYPYGITPGQPAYPHMDHYIISDSLSFEAPHEKVKVVSGDPELIRRLKSEAGTDIYLCGGGQLAGWFLDNGLIDLIKIKLNPFLSGGGVRLFGTSQRWIELALKEASEYEHGLGIRTYQVKY